MTNKYFSRICFLLFVAFIFLCLFGERTFAQQEDTADVRVIYTTSYPGRFAEVEVMLKNPVAIAGFDFTFTISNHELFDFHTDSICVDLDTIPVDTCTWEPESLHYQHPECYVDSIVERAVRYCYIDTVGSLISEFQIVECHGTLGDTSLPDCKSVQVLGMGQLMGDSIYIPPNPSYRTLFKLGVDVFCLPDSTDDRTVSFYTAPGGNSFLSDRQGKHVPFYYHQGELTVWWSVWGDASGDSLVDLGDVLYLVSYLYKGGLPPCVPETGDPNGDCFIDLGDVLYLLSYLYKGGVAPNPGCWYGKKEE